MTRPPLSIVTTIYHTAGVLEPFVTRTDAIAGLCGFGDYEMILVVDGSPDGALEEARRLKARFPRLRVIELSRNFGHHAALWCGLEAARGDLIFLIDSDLETPPEILRDLNAALTDGVDVAFACRKRRREPFLRRWASRLFWRVFGALAAVRIPPDMLTERLMRRSYVDALLSLGDRTLFLGGMMQWIGFRQVPVAVERDLRRGPPSYSWVRRAALALEALTSFSTAPMLILFATGAVLASVSMLTAVALIAVKLARPDLIMPGFAATTVLMLFFLGAILAAIGLVGLYLGKVFQQTKQRPIYIVRNEF